jgi:DNA-directed RNA polymerase beta' subunit
MIFGGDVLGHGVYSLIKEKQNRLYQKFISETKSKVKRHIEQYGEVVLNQDELDALEESAMVKGAFSV